MTEKAQKLPKNTEPTPSSDGGLSVPSNSVSENSSKTISTDLEESLPSLDRSYSLRDFLDLTWQLYQDHHYLLGHDEFALLESLAQPKELEEYLDSPEKLRWITLSRANAEREVSDSLQLIADAEIERDRAVLAEREAQQLLAEAEKLQRQLESVNQEQEKELAKAVAFQMSMERQSFNLRVIWALIGLVALCFLAMFAAPLLTAKAKVTLTLITTSEKLQLVIIGILATVVAGVFQYDPKKGEKACERKCDKCGK